MEYLTLFKRKIQSSKVTLKILGAILFILTDGLLVFFPFFPFIIVAPFGLDSDTPKVRIISLMTIIATFSLVPIVLFLLWLLEGETETNRKSKKEK